MTQTNMEKQNNNSDSEEQSDSESLENESVLDDENENTDEERVLDSDEELQEAFAAGLLKPGLNTVIEKTERHITNNVAGLKQKTDELAAPLKRLPWIEKLDHVVLKLAPLAPELALKEEEHEKKRQKLMKSAGADFKSEGDTVHNDFKRELTFYRQAQATVLEVIPRLKSMGIPTKRPDDYFAQMAKTDDHMNKIREKLVSKQATEDRMEKVRKLRDLKKFGKKVQQEVTIKRAKEKKEMLDQVKKFRKGQGGNLDFLQKDERDANMDQDGPVVKQKKQQHVKNTSSQKSPHQGKRDFKEKKFGFGGKKKGSKMNDKESVNDISGYKRPNLPGKKGGAKGSKKPGGKNQRNQRMGKERRQKTKHGKK